MAGPINIALPSLPTDGNTLIAVVGTGDATGGGVTSIVQTGATWQLAAKKSAGKTLEIWYAPNVSSAVQNVVINLNAGVFEGSAVVIEYANIAVTAPLDQIATSSGNSDSPNTGTSPTTTKAEELWVGGLLTKFGEIVSNPVNDFSIEAQDNTGATADDVNTAFLSKIVTATAAAFTEADIATSREWAGAVATFFGPTTSQFTVDMSVSIEGAADLDVAAAFGSLLLTAGMDLWIADGGAASQLFALDTKVSTPLILGSHIVSDPGADESYTIANLDDDVVSIGLGVNAVGVLSLSSFVNDGDGTGSFLATFDPDIPARQLTIIATDDVDNESAESPIFIVNSFEQVELSEELTIIPKPSVSTPTCDRLLAEVPKSGFTLQRQFTIPFSFNTSEFELRAITSGSPVTVTVLRRGLAADLDETQQYTVIPENEVTVMNIRLGRGVNVVTAIDSFGRSDTIIVAATTYAAVLCSYAREIFNFSQVEIEDQAAAIFSPVSTRLAEPLLSFADLLPDVKAQQTLATKLAIRSLVNNPGSHIGTQDLLTALTLSTPIFKQQNPDDELFEPAIRPLYNVQEAFAGVEAHVWPANECVRQWLAFINYINNVSLFKVVEISENEVIFVDENGDTQRHVFDFKEDRCSLTDLVQQSICFESIDVRVSIFSESDFTICAVAYPFDMRPVPSNPIGQLAGELENTLGLDPGFDGYVDFSVTDHWDSRTPLDNQGPQPAVGSGLPVCVHENGHLVVPLMLASTNITIDQFVTSSGTITAQPAVAADMDVSLDLAGVEVTAAMDVSIKLPQDELSLDLVILGEVEMTVGLNVAITNSPTVTVGLSVSISS